MEIYTTRFGTIDIEEKLLITFDEGIPGFEDEKMFFFFETEQSKPLVWMQSVNHAHIALPVINPFLIKEDYMVELSDDETSELDIQSEADIMVWLVCIVPADITQITANLSAPVVVNVKNGKGKQFVTDIKEYAPRFPIFKQIVKLLEGAKDAGTVSEG